MKREMRLQLIKELITDNEIKTQEELACMLLGKGLNVTQATISRDLRCLRLFKVPGSGTGFKYSFKADEDYYSLEKLKNKVRDSLLCIEAINYFVIIKTLPGHAHSYGAILDAIEIDGKAGTICGNDTCLVIFRTTEGAERFKDIINPINP